MKLSKDFLDFYKYEVGYKSSYIENPNLTKEQYSGYYNNGSYYTSDQLKKMSPDERLKEEFVRLETINFKHTIETFLEHPNIKEVELSSGMLKSMSGTLLRNLDDKKFESMMAAFFVPVWNKKTQKLHYDEVGEFRSIDINKDIQGINVSFMPGTKVLDLIENLVQITNKSLNDSSLTIEDKIKAISLFHLNFELIHPFGEGNGRVGRLMTDILALQNGISPIIFESQKNMEKSENYSNRIHMALLPKEDKQDWSLFTEEPAAWKNFVRKTIIKSENELEINNITVFEDLEMDM